MSLPNILFITVSDHYFFPGTLAAVNGILYFHPDATICVVDNNLDNEGLTEQAQQLLRDNNVVVLAASCFNKLGRKLAAWELKAYAANDLATDHELIIGFDSDLLICSPLNDIIEQALATGHWFGGKDGDIAHYGDDFSPYGFETPAENPKYMSTSLYFCPTTAENLTILSQWTECTNQAEYNGQGNYPGHGDQGVLNALLYKQTNGDTVSLLPNRQWSQHWTYWDDVIVFDNSNNNPKFINISDGELQQRAFHCGGGEKFWDSKHIQRIREKHSGQLAAYTWFLFLLWFGQCRNYTAPATSYITKESWHLISDVFAYKKYIMEINPHLSEDDWEILENLSINQIPN